MSPGNSRLASARKTRANVLEAAAALFSEHGYGGTTMQAIADRAGVSVETVGLAGPKRRLLRAAFDMSFAGSVSKFPASGEPAYIELTAELGLAAAVTEYARLLASSIARTSGLWQAFQAAADADPKASALFDEVRGIRRTEFARTAQWLADRGVVEQARVPWLIQEFFVIASHETYLLLRAECAYTPDDFATRLDDEIGRILVAVRP